MWIPTGSTLLNLCISQDPYGGFKAGRVHRIVGESSATKTGLAASAFFLGALYLSRKEIPFKFIYDDVERTFDLDYYQQAYPFMEEFLDDGSLVLYSENASETVEEFVSRFVKLCEECESDGKVGFYFVDSLDSLPPKDELKRFQKEGVSTSVNPALKANLLSQFFQDNVSRMTRANTGLVIVSQIRDALQMGPMRMGPTQRVSGGRAIQFYSSAIISLKKRKEETADIGEGKSNQATGVKMEAVESIDIEFKVTKNKLGRPFLSGFFTFVVSTGAIDDVRDIVEFLKQVGVFERAGGWYRYDGQSMRGDQLEPLVRSDIHKFRQLVTEKFLENLNKTKTLSDISTIW